jgi:cytochrome P450
MLLPNFTKKNLKHNELIYQVGSQNLVDTINEKLSQGKSDVFDLYKYFECSALDLITNILIGSNLNTVSDSEAANEFFGIYYYSQCVLFLKGLIPSISKIPIPNVEYYKYLIEQSVKRRQSGDIQREDVLQSLMEGEDPKTGERLTINEIIEEFFIIMYAGLDTASNTMTWTLFEILSNPKVYDLVKLEVLSNFPDLTKPLNISDCESKLKYLEATIWESMRKHPVVEMFARRVPSGGVTIGDHYLPEKVIIFNTQVKFPLLII